MSLDLAILDEMGVPRNEVPIDIDNYGRLMKIVDENSGLLMRLDDYYADVVFECSEMEKLIAEVKHAIKQCNNDERLLSLLNEILNLCEIAKFERTSVVALAD